MSVAPLSERDLDAIERLVARVWGSSGLPSWAPDDAYQDARFTAREGRALLSVLRTFGREVALDP